MRGYVDVPVVIADVEIRHLLIVVEKHEYPLLIGMDVVLPHAAILDLGADSLRLRLLMGYLHRPALQVGSAHHFFAASSICWLE